MYDESTIEGTELSIGGGGGEGHPKSIQIDTTGRNFIPLWECQSHQCWAESPYVGLNAPILVKKGSNLRRNPFPSGF